MKTYTFLTYLITFLSLLYFGITNTRSYNAYLLFIALFVNIIIFVILKSWTDINNLTKEIT